MILFNRRTGIYREVETERESVILLQMGIFDIVEVIPDEEEVKPAPKKRGRKPKPKTNQTNKTE